MDGKPPPYAPPGSAPYPAAPSAYMAAPPPGAYPPPPPPPGAYPPPPPAGAYPPSAMQRTFQGGAFIPPDDGQYQNQGPYPPHPPGMLPNYGTVVVPPHMLPAPQPPQPGYIQPTTVVAVQPAESIILVGGCPACRVGVLEDDFTCAGICMAIFFFPLGVLCCMAMKQRRCPNCGATFG